MTNQSATESCQGAHVSIHVCATSVTMAYGATVPADAADERHYTPAVMHGDFEPAAAREFETSRLSRFRRSALLAVGVAAVGAAAVVMAVGGAGAAGGSVVHTADGKMSLQQVT